MTILLALIIVQIGNAIIADMNGKFPYLKEQEGTNAQIVTNKCVIQERTMSYMMVWNK